MVVNYKNRWKKIYFTTEESAAFLQRSQNLIQEITLRNTMKFLQFWEDYRPAFYGTYSKSSKVIHGKSPWTRDKAIFNYEYDSEAEWEEGDPGEIYSLWQK